MIYARWSSYKFMSDKNKFLQFIPLPPPFSLVVIISEMNKLKIALVM